MLPGLSSFYAQTGYNWHMNTIARVVKKVRLSEAKNDAEYWRAQPYAMRLAALEQIRCDNCPA